MLVEQVTQPVHDRLPAVGEEGLRMPVDINQRPLDGCDRPAARGAQQQVVVLTVAARNVLIDQADDVEDIAPDQEGGRPHLRDPAPDQLAQRDAWRRWPLDDPVRVVKTRAAGRELRTGGLKQSHLKADLLRQPRIIVIAEGHEIAAACQDPAVAGTSKARAPGIGNQPQRPAGWHVSGYGRLLGSVKDHNALDVAGIRLTQDAPHRPLEQLRTVPGWYDNANRRPPSGTGWRHSPGRRFRHLLGPVGAHR